MNAADIAALIERHRYTVTCEADLVKAVSSVLAAAGCSFSSEVRLSARERLDFLVGPVGLELKVSSHAGPVLRQVTRYMQHDRVAELVLVTTCRRHVLPPMVLGKPVRVAMARPAL
jgi:hypothetical protein